MYTSNILVGASLAAIALAKTDLSGCTSTDVSSPAGASLAYYVPGTGEICAFLDCGGGRAPPKTTVPGCPQYSGTLTYSPSYLPGYGSATASPISSAESKSSEAATTESTAMISSSMVSSEAPVYASSMASASMTSSSSVSETIVSTSSTLSTSTITSAPVAPVSGNGTVTSPTSSNGTVANGSPSASATYDSGAMEAARVWVGGAGFLALGAIVAAL